MRVDEDPDRDARNAWLALSARQRREVDKLARKGRLHPDPQVSRVSCLWAQSRLRDQASRGLFGRSVFMLGGSGGVDVRISELRVARAVSKLCDSSGDPGD